MNILENINKTQVPEMDWDTQKNISYTQFSLWSECPHKWKLQYIDKIKQPPNIYFSFGTAMHETLQEYLELMFNKGQQHADEFDAHSDFQERFTRLYKEDVDTRMGGKHFSTKEQLIEFSNDGLEIIDFFLRHRQEHFQKHGWELLGIEMPILTPPHEDYPDILLMGKLDLVMFNKTTHQVVIWDIKTSTRGWTKWDKQNKLKTSQMAIYKIPVENIDCRYFIVKRKIPDNPKYAVMKSRIQKFEPSSGKTTQNRIVNGIRSFVEDCFEGDRYNENKVYLKKPSDKACKWCPFKDKPELCDKENKGISQFEIS